MRIVKTNEYPLVFTEVIFKTRTYLITENLSLNTIDVRKCLSDPIDYIKPNRLAIE